MSELDVVKKTKKLNTVDTLYDDLINLGIKENDTLLVHSSLSSIGWTSGGEYAVNLALLKAVKNGTLVMPSHSNDNSDPANWVNPPVPKEWIEEIRRTMPSFHVNDSITRGMGRICEHFRRMENTKRSNHPQTSFAANGVDANEIVKTHDLTPQFGLRSPLGTLYQTFNTKILLLGVGYGNNTSFHLGEALLDLPKRKQDGSSMMVNGRNQWVQIEDYDYDDEDFVLIGEAYEKESNNIIKGKIGQADCILLLNLKEAVDFSVKWMKENR